MGNVAREDVRSDSAIALIARVDEREPAEPCWNRRVGVPADAVSGTACSRRARALKKILRYAVRYATPRCVASIPSCCRARYPVAQIALPSEHAEHGNVDDGEHVVLPDAQVIRLGFENITYQVAGRQLVLPYSIVQPGSVIVLGDRGPLIVPKWVIEKFGLDGSGR